MGVWRFPDEVQGWRANSYVFTTRNVDDERGGVWAVGGACLSVLEAGFASPFPRDGPLSGLRLVSTPALLAAYYVISQPWGRKYYFVYFLPFWAVYIASAVLLLFVCIEVFRSALSGLPGLMKFGIVIFRWAIVVSVVLTFSSISFVHHGLAAVPDLASGLMRSVGILALCLLAFLCLSMNALRLSIRDMAFGISLGFGVMCSNDFVIASVISHDATLTAPLQLVYEAVILGALGIWISYCAAPVAARKLADDAGQFHHLSLERDCLSAGPTGTQLCSSRPAALTDVEKVVEKVLTRNLKGRESEKQRQVERSSRQQGAAMPRPFALCARQGALTWGWKSPTHPARGSVS